MLIVAGSLVTSTESGLSVPDWPLSYGRIFPPMIGGIRFEHTHRMIAGTVALLTLWQAVWIWRTDQRKWVRNLGVLAFGLVLFQAILGGLTVLLLLPWVISVLHACTAQTFFVVAGALSVVTSEYWQNIHEQHTERDTNTYGNLVQFSALTLASVFLQLILGALRRHNVAGIHPHLFGGVMVTVISWSLFAYINSRFSGKSDLWLGGLFLSFLVLAEVFLGAGAFAARTQSSAEIEPPTGTVLLTVAHVAVGALVLASAAFLFLISSAYHRNNRT